jgi:aryl-alcohol dehydrogenase-like predicted oxidoreductase
MITSTWKDRELSRLMLGTVQFGMPYGVANRTGQPTYRDVLNIVATAVEGGVNCFDTAAAYGTSEEVLGRVITELEIADQVTIVTKIRPLNPTELSDAKLASQAIEQSVADSRQRLQRDCLPMVLFHREADAVHRDVLHELQARGWVRQIGVSCDNRPGPASEFAAAGDISALQIPGNILDRRHQQSGIFQRASSLGVAVFIRSVYLQGLLFIPEKDVPLGLRDVLPVRRQLALLADQAGMDLAELALRYLLSQEGVTCVLTGVETVQQIQENLEMFGRGPLPHDLLIAINAVKFELSEMVLTPGLWNLSASVQSSKSA